MSKVTKYGDSARDAILRGVDFLADAVRITEGPRGRNCILGQRALGQTPKVTRDGVTVSNYTDPSDPTEQLGADLIREAAQKTDNAVGDGTTASIVLSQAMIHRGFELIKAGANPMAIERGIHKATEAVIAHIRKTAVEVSGDKIFQVATVSAHGDVEIGKLVAAAIEKAGKDGVLTAEPSTTSDTYVEAVAGLELEKSNLLSPVFITHPEEVKGELSNCKILLWEGVIATAKSVVPILSQVKDTNTPLLIIAGGYEAEALSCIINNRVRASLPVIAVRIEAYGDRRKETLRDIAALCGGKAYTEELGLKIDNVKLTELGSARKTITTMSKTQILEGKGNQAELAGRVQGIRDMLVNAEPGTKSALKKRLAALLGGITVIKVGGTTVTEMEEKKDRVVDAMSAAKAAVESGVVAGGGMALFHSMPSIYVIQMPKAERVGAEVVAFACEAVLKQIAENAGISGSAIVNQAMATTQGFNAFTEQFEDLVATGIIDPAKVVIESLKNASAVACSILTMGATVSEKVMEKTNG
jgi:chaperonin GroEL